MLTINDLYNERQLSSVEMGKVAGGTPIIINSNIVQIEGSGSPGFTISASQLHSLILLHSAGGKHST